MIEENHEKPQSGLSAPGFESGTSRMRVSCVTTEPPRSVLGILRLRKPLKTSTRLAGHGIWIRDLPNASLLRYHGATAFGSYLFLHKAMRVYNWKPREVLNILWTRTFTALKYFEKCSKIFQLIDSPIKNYRARWLRGNSRDSHSGGSRFESRCRPTWLGFFRGFPQSSRQILDWIFITTINLTIIHQIHIS